MIPSGTEMTFSSGISISPNLAELNRMVLLVSFIEAPASIGGQDHHDLWMLRRKKEPFRMDL
jgi:hypothetical protein